MNNTMTHPLVSVIIPTHGASSSLVHSIDSVIEQTYRNIEIIVVDDNGRNNANQIKTEKMVSNYIKKDFFKYVVLEKNSNASVARNTGFKLSKGEYISLLDDDDIYTQNKIEEQVNVLKKLDSSWGMVYCSYEKYLDKKYFETIRATKNGNILFNILLHKPSATSGSLLIRRNIYESLKGFDETFWRHQDWEFTARIASEYKVASVNNIGLLKNYTKRNAPTETETILKYRKQYLNQIYPLTSKMSKTKKEIAVLYNTFEGTTGYLRDKKVKEFLTEFKKTNKEYLKKYSKMNLFIVILLKIFDKLERILKGSIPRRTKDNFYEER